MIDVARVRADTPGCESVVHLNNTGSSLPPRQVVDAVVEYLRLEERIGDYEAHDRMATSLERIYGLAASMLNCSPAEIAFTGTEGREATPGRCRNQCFGAGTA